MSGSKARLDAIDAVKNYKAPEAIFPAAEAPGRDLRRERLHQGGHAEAPAQAGLQVADGRPSSTPSRSTRPWPTWSPRP